jgi:hypothetical protein
VRRGDDGCPKDKFSLVCRPESKSLMRTRRPATKHEKMMFKRICIQLYPFHAQDTVNRENESITKRAASEASVPF